MTETERILMVLGRDKNAAMTLAEIVTEEIDRFVCSAAYQIMQTAEQYYRNRSDVQNKKNHIEKRSNTKIEHPNIRKLVDQKVNYTLSRPFSITGSRKEYSVALDALFDDAVRQKVKRFGRGAPKLGIGWMIPFFNAQGKLAFSVVPATQLIPFWADDEHAEINGFLYFYDTIVYEGRTPRVITKAELWNAEGVRYYMRQTGRSFGVDPDKPELATHFMVDGLGYNWRTSPIVWCRYNDEELPLQYFLRELADDINWQTSSTSDVLRDVAKFIWILKNYAGEGLDEFVDNLRKCLAINVDADGGVDTIQPNLQVDAVLAFIDKQRRDLYDLGAGVDTKDPQLGSASGRAIQFRYMDLDTDSAHLQSELRGAFLRLKPFLDDYFQIIGAGSFYADSFEVIFNTDMPADEPAIFECARAAREIGVSMRTVLANIPWVKDVDAELQHIADEAAELAVRKEQEAKLLSGLNFPEAPMPWDGEPK